MVDNDLSTLQKIRAEGKRELLENSFKAASLRNIVKRAGITTACVGIDGKCLVGAVSNGNAFAGADAVPWVCRYLDGIVGSGGVLRLLVERIKVKQNGKLEVTLKI